MAPNNIIAIGHTAVDHIYRISDFPSRPTKVRALKRIEDGGGSAANAAVAIARLGGQVQLWSRVGQDEAGQKALALLEQAGVGTVNVLKHATSRTSNSVVIVDRRGERLVVSERDDAMPESPDWLPFSDIRTASVVTSDSSWREATLAAFRSAAAAKVSTILDIDVAAGLPSREMLQFTSHAISSAEAIVGTTSSNGLKDRLGELQARGARHAGVTLGRQGYRWLAEDGSDYHQHAFEVEPVDTTGAGDAFHGAFAWGINCGLDDAECARLASAVAALKCRRLGARAGLPTVRELDQFLQAQCSRGLGESILSRFG